MNRGDHFDGGFCTLRESETSFGVHLENFFYCVDVSSRADVQPEVVLLRRSDDALSHCGCPLQGGAAFLNDKTAFLVDFVNFL